MNVTLVTLEAVFVLFFYFNVNYGGLRPFLCHTDFTDITDFLPSAIAAASQLYVTQKLRKSQKFAHLAVSGYRTLVANSLFSSLTSKCLLC